MTAVWRRSTPLWTFYSDGGRKNPGIDAEIHPLQLVVEEKQALVAFLNALSGSISEGQP